MYEVLLQIYPKTMHFPITKKIYKIVVSCFNPIPPGLFESGSAWGGGGGGRKVPAAYNSNTINDNEMKFGGVVKDH